MVIAIAAHCASLFIALIACLGISSFVIWRWAWGVLVATWRIEVQAYIAPSLHVSLDTLRRLTMNIKEKIGILFYTPLLPKSALTDSSSQSGSATTTTPFSAPPAPNSSSGGLTSATTSQTVTATSRVPPEGATAIDRYPPSTPVISHIRLPVLIPQLRIPPTLHPFFQAFCRFVPNMIKNTSVPTSDEVDNSSPCITYETSPSVNGPFQSAASTSKASFSHPNTVVTPSAPLSTLSASSDGAVTSTRSLSFITLHSFTTSESLRPSSNSVLRLFFRNAKARSQVSAENILSHTTYIPSISSLNSSTEEDPSASTSCADGAVAAPPSIASHAGVESPIGTSDEADLVPKVSANGGASADPIPACFSVESEEIKGETGEYVGKGKEKEREREVPNDQESTSSFGCSPGAQVNVLDIPTEEVTAEKIKKTDDGSVHPEDAQSTELTAGSASSTSQSKISDEQELERIEGEDTKAPTLEDLIPSDNQDARTIAITESNVESTLAPVVKDADVGSKGTVMESDLFNKAGSERTVLVQSNPIVITGKGKEKTKESAVRTQQESSSSSTGTEDNRAVETDGTSEPTEKNKVKAERSQRVIKNAEGSARPEDAQSTTSTSTPQSADTSIPDKQERGTEGEDDDMVTKVKTSVFNLKAEPAPAHTFTPGSAVPVKPESKRRIRGLPRRARGKDGEPLSYTLRDKVRSGSAKLEGKDVGLPPATDNTEKERRVETERCRTPITATSAFVTSSESSGNSPGSSSAYVLVDGKENDGHLRSTSISSGEAPNSREEATVNSDSSGNRPTQD
ncbi:hypothetical protein V5O48_017340 [Marasmius crinis-equi]|uniref:Uncharacterized protein n=1 Tax=Marasmius crinis-equi TaxID=585013 RepID=A0ABR3EP84_9AGAR